MIKIPKEILEDIKKIKIFPLSTCSKDNIPNVIPIGIFEVDTSSVSQDFIYIMDNYYLKTMKNIMENPYVSFYIWSPETKNCTQIKGKVINIFENGNEYEKYAQKYKLIKPNLPCKHLLKIEILELFNCKSGPNAGSKII